ncbi:Endoplasmic reticulum metallopeptidase 1 [Chytriomyces hyalinus]|nr:Endoplasmic reticulum metallopeptidase 1 [Chytriomyces hyalinus]
MLKLLLVFAVVQFLVHILNLPKFQIGNIDTGIVRTSNAVFSSARAKDHLDSLSTHGPRPFSSPANDRALQSLVARLMDGATDRLQVQIDADVMSNAVFNDGAGGVSAKRFSLALNNVVATLAGTCLAANSCPTLLVSSHYDSVVGAPGITDDGMAVAAMVEIIRVLETRPPLPYSVVFLFNNAEESGLLGARHFVSSNSAFSNVRASINLEGSGSGGPAMLFRSVAYDLDLLNAYAGSVKTPFASVLGNDVMALKLVKSSTDHEIYTSPSISGSAGSAKGPGKFANRAGLDIAFFQDRYKYHTRNDKWYPDLIYSLQHMGDSTLKTIISLANNEKFMNPVASERAIVPGVYWHELIRIMPVLSFGFYLATCVLILAWMTALIFVGVQRMRNFIKAHAKNVSNVRLQLVVPLFLASTLGSIFLPILVIALIEKIRPLATYGDTFTTRNLTWACSVLGSLIPFYAVPSIFGVNHSDSDHPQQLLHWHVCQLGALISWAPVAFLVLLSSWYKVGMLHSHATFLIFGLSAITLDWYYLRPWFGKERKQGDDYDRADDEAAVHESHGRSFEPAHVAALGIAIVWPLLSLLNTRRSLVLAMEPTIQDGTPALAVASLITLFTFIVPIAALPHLLSQRKPMVLMCRGLIAVTLAGTLVLIFPTAAPFTPAHPLKLRLEVDMDLTNATNPSEFANLHPTAHIYLNAIALAHVEHVLSGVDQARDCTMVRVRGVRMGRCSLGKFVKSLRGVSFPTSNLVSGTEVESMDEVLDVTHEVSEAGTIQVSVKSKYSRVCFLRGVEELNGKSWRLEESEGVYPYNVWNGGLESEPKEADGTVKEAVNFMSHFRETGVFGARLNQTQMEALGISSLEMQVGCYVDDLQHLPLWQDLEEKVLPDWTVFMAAGYGVLSVSKRFRVTF